jgi:hypothetical protein
LFDDTADWDNALVITNVVSSVLWLMSSMIYLGAFILEVVKQRQLRKDTEDTDHVSFNGDSSHQDNNSDGIA